MWKSCFWKGKNSHYFPSFIRLLKIFCHSNHKHEIIDSWVRVLMLLWHFPFSKFHIFFAMTEWTRCYSIYRHGVFCLISWNFSLLPKLSVRGYFQPLVSDVCSFFLQEKEWKVSDRDDKNRVLKRTRNIFRQ